MTEPSAQPNNSSPSDALKQAKALAAAARQARLSTLPPLPTELDLYKKERQKQAQHRAERKARGLFAGTEDAEEEEFRRKYTERRYFFKCYLSDICQSHEGRTREVALIETEANRSTRYIW